MENTSDSFMPRPLLFCLKSERSVCYSVPDNKGTDNIAVEKVSMREIMTDHYDQSRSYIDRLQVTIPGLTAKKMASIRTNLKLL